uniref:Uncharacterized protein n=1 Tax=Arundo donax TaxID=35708 RepID=A0A0A8Y247_ARUDO
MIFSSKGGQHEENIIIAAINRTRVHRTII